MADQESLKKRIHRGEIITGFGVPMDIARSQLENILKTNSYDFVFVDNQHAAFSEDTLVRFCAMADESVVDEAIDAFYYPQTGKRSWGGRRLACLRSQ